ncbi:hypothetical protein HDU87_000319 [Geranomyces variabilis]|uniref:Uncharacterized protein n=1 Tax=Geranomyces variabilis TaxID=109894 RepID=A0AAD5XT33_9FUNG|nr:hypothetical protein HDU87_000319 [Geranomyces variabilis]
MSGVRVCKTQPKDVPGLSHFLCVTEWSGGIGITMPSPNTVAAFHRKLQSQIAGGTGLSEIANPQVMAKLATTPATISELALSETPAVNVNGTCFWQGQHSAFEADNAFNPSRQVFLVDIRIVWW